MQRRSPYAVAEAWSNIMRPPFVFATARWIIDECAFLLLFVLALPLTLAAAAACVGLVIRLVTFAIGRFA